LVVKTMQNEGPTFIIRFNNAEGIEPGKTKIRFKDVDVGIVKTAEVSSDRKQVVLTAKLVKDADDYLVSDSRFWVVRPHISGGNVSGLSTLLSGAYIGVDVGKSTKRQSEFTGLEVPPVLTDNLPGRQFVLHSSEMGSLDVGAAVTFRRIPVGQVVAYSLDPDGKNVTLKIFINAPYDRFVNDNTKFWHSSGFDLALDANGIRLESQSLASLIQGGLSFQTPVGFPSSSPSEKDHTFTLYLNREQAMRLPDQETHSYTVYFKDSLRGLSLGAPVDIHGIIVGEVVGIGIEYSKVDAAFLFPVEINIYPDRIRSRARGDQIPTASSDSENRILTEKLVDAGMRAQLRTSSLLTGQLYISLDFYHNVHKEFVNWKHSPPTIPTIDGDLGAIQESLGSILRKIDKMPLNQLSTELLAAAQQLTHTLKDTDGLIERIDTEVTPEVRSTLMEAHAALSSADKVLQEQSPLQFDLREALKQVTKSAKAIGDLADYLDRHPDSLIRGKAQSNAPKVGADR